MCQLWYMLEKRFEGGEVTIDEGGVGINYGDYIIGFIMDGNRLIFMEWFFDCTWTSPGMFFIVDLDTMERDVRWLFL